MSIREERARFRARVGPFIQSVREHAGLEQRDIAKRFGLSPAWLSEIENGKSNVYAYDLAVLADMTGTKLSSFYRGFFDISELAPPRSLEDWKALYPDQPHVAQVHYEIDKSFETAELRHTIA